MALISSAASTSANKSYASAASTYITSCFPKRDQAIILDAADELRLCDYVLNVGSIVGPKNIVSASRIANNRICIYLSNKQIAENLVNIHQTIQINGINIKLRKLITPSKRILISNVCSSIPHQLIEDALKEQGLKIVSQITTLKAGIPGDEYSHVESFRRQVFVAPPPDENDNLPSSIIITFENTSYRIFLTYDDVTCFICKKNGHIASKCTNLSRNELNNTPDPANENKNMKDDHATNTQNLNEHQQAPEIQKKRPSPSSTSTENSTTVNENNTETLNPEIIENLKHTENPFKAPNSNKELTSHKNKRPKRSTSPEDIIPLSQQYSSSSTESIVSNSDSAFQPIESLIEENPEAYPLSFVNFKCFIENCYGKNDPLAELKRFTSDTEAVLTMMETTYPKLESSSLKNRFTRLRKKLEKQWDQQKHTETNRQSPNTSHIH